MSDLRGAPRKRCLIGAKVILTHQASQVNCLVRSLSESGAKIEFETQQILPHQFVLKLDTGPEFRIKSIAWQRDRQFGIIFDQLATDLNEQVFEQKRNFNIAAFGDEVSTQAPVQTASARPATFLTQTPPTNSGGNDFGLEYRRRMLENGTKPR